MKSIPATRISAGAALVAACFPWFACAQPAGVDARADTLLRATTSYLAGLQQFSVRSENSLEVMTTEGQNLQFISPATVIVSRPNKLKAQRHGDIDDQSLYYDGKTLTLFNHGAKHYATVAAPPNINSMLEFARSRLDVVTPGGDFLDTGAYELLMREVTTGSYLGVEVVGGQRCHHLAYRAAEVDWQLWVREGDRPSPCRYVITSKTVAGGPQFTIQIVKFDTAPRITEGMFRFVAPSGAKVVEFLPLSQTR